MNKQLFKSFSVVSCMTLISRVTGFARDMVVAYFFGTSAANDAFVIAFKIPNFMRGLLGEGAFSQAFVPVLSEYRRKNALEETKQFVHATATAMGLALLIILLCLEAGTPFVAALFAPGFLENHEQFKLVTDLLKICLPYSLLICLTAMFAAVLNCWGKFAVPSFTPVFLNVTSILAAAVFSRYFEIPITALAWGVLVAGMIQFVFQLPSLYRIGLFPRFQGFLNNRGVLRVLKLMVPALFGVSVAQVGLLISSFFASFLPEGSVSWLYYSERLAYFPVGLFGVALSTVIVPFLSSAHAKETYEVFSNTLDRGLQTMLLIGLPSAIGLFVMAGPLLATLFEGGRFTAQDVQMTQTSLQAMAIGVPAFMSCKVLVSGFYSLQDIKTPVRVAVISLITNIVLNILFIVPLKHTGLALATSISYWVNTVLLVYQLNKKSVYQSASPWKSFLGSIVFTNGLLSALLFFGVPELQVWLSWTKSHRIWMLLAWMAAFIPLYFGAVKGIFWLFQRLEKRITAAVQEREVTRHAE